MRTFVGVLLVSGVVVTVACIGSDPDPVSPGGSTSSGSTSGGSTSGSVDADADTIGSCPLGCLPPAPEGWIGPSATYDGAFAKPEPPCGGNYTLAEVTKDSYGLGETAAHSCRCAPSGPESPRCVVRLTPWNDSSCTGTQLTAKTHAAGECVGTAVLGGRSIDVGVPMVRGDCSESEASPIVPTANLARHLVACGLTQRASCEGRPDCTATPLPLPEPFTRLCIHRKGDVACPDGPDYSQRVVVGRVSDTRGCDPCTTTLVGQCAPGVTLFNTSDTCTLSGAAIPSTGCIPIDSGVPVALRLAESTMPFSCRTTPQPKGALEIVEPITFCCNK